MGNSKLPLLSARIHEYKKPLVIDELQIPLAISGEQVLLRVAATGLCHSDLHLIDGELKDVIPLNLPNTPGREVAGWVEKAGDLVPQDFVAEGDLTTVFLGWSCGVCHYCKSGDEQLCHSSGVLLRVERSNPFEYMRIIREK